MDNLLLTPNVFAKLIVMNLGRDLFVCKNMCHDVTPEFTNKKNPIGASVMVRKPYRFSVSKGLGYQPQPIVDTQTPVQISQVAQVSYDWDSIERTLQIRSGDAMTGKQFNGLNDLFAGPAAVALASTINAEAATFVADNTANNVGTLGAPPSTQDSYLKAGDYLVAQGLPNEEQKNLVLIINRRMSTAFINGTVGYYNPQNVIGKQLEDGEMVPRLMGYKIEMDQTINRHSNGTYSGTPLCNGATPQTAAGGNNATMNLNTDGWGVGVSQLTKGTKFTIGSASSATIGGVNSVHPQTKKDTGYQQCFTVLADTSDISGAMATLPIYPAITPATVDAQYANVTGGAVDNAIITVVGASAVTGDQGLLMHEQAFAFVSVPIVGPDPGEGATVAEINDEETGIALSLIKAFDARTRTHIHRVDVLYDFARLYGELACVIQG